MLYFDFSSRLKSPITMSFLSCKFAAQFSKMLNWLMNACAWLRPYVGLKDPYKLIILIFSDISRSNTTTPLFMLSRVFIILYVLLKLDHYIFRIFRFIDEKGKEYTRSKMKIKSLLEIVYSQYVQHIFNGNH